MNLAAVVAATLAIAATACSAESGAAGTETGVLKTLTAGDRACYAGVENAGGETRELMAAFEICERTDLVGKRVALVSRKERVSAESCQGDPECAAQEEVMLVVEMTPAR